MTIEVLTYPTAAAEKRIQKIVSRRLSYSETAERVVADIVAAVQREGDGALVRYTRAYDAPEFTRDRIRVCAVELTEAREAVDPEFISLLQRARNNITRFHEAQRRHSWFRPEEDGTLLGPVIRPVAGAGLYIPGGRRGETPLILQTFVKVVDAVGGIDVYLPTDVDGTPIDDKTEDMGYFDSGQHHFTGDQALRFSRIRKRYNDFTRADNQNLVICALKEKITSPSVLPKIPQIISAFHGSVLTDLSPQQFAQLACLVARLRSENLIFTGLPEEILTPGRVDSAPSRGTAPISLRRTLT